MIRGTVQLNRTLISFGQPPQALEIGRSPCPFWLFATSEPAADVPKLDPEIFKDTLDNMAELDVEQERLFAGRMLLGDASCIARCSAEQLSERKLPLLQLSPDCGRESRCSATALRA